MTQAAFLAVRNFERFQHYKNRNPPWIKLHASLLDDYQFGRLRDASKMHLMGIWVLASKTDNKIPNDPEWIARRIGATEPVDLEALVMAGFLERRDPGSKLLARRKRTALPVEERRVEGEVEKKTDVVVLNGNGNSKHSKETWLTPFSDLWTSGTPPYAQLARYLKPLIEDHGDQLILGHWNAYLKATEPRFWSPARFASTWVSWNGTTPADGITDEPNFEYIDQ